MADSTHFVPAPIMTLVAQSPLPLIVVSPDFLIVQTTAAAHDVAPLPPGTSVFSWIHRTEQPQLLSALTGPGRHFLLQVRVGQAGQWRFCHVVGQRSSHDDTYWLLTLVDVTEARQRARYLEAFVAVGREFHLAEFVFRITQEQFELSPAAYALHFGTPVDRPKVVSRVALGQTVHPNDLGRTLQRRMEAAAHETNFHAEYRIVWPSGEIRWISGFGGFLRDMNDEPILAGFYADVTEAHQRREKILQTERLQSLSILAGGIAHDFNNKLTVIMGHLSLLESWAAEHPEANLSVEKAQIAAEQARDLARELISLSRDTPMQSQIVAVDTLVDSVRIWAAHYPRHRFIFDVPDGVWNVNGDPTQLQQVVDNVVRNALQAMPFEGTLRISVQNVFPGDPEEPMVEICIADSGPGIPAAVKRKLFDPFFTTKPGGHGLGLASAHAIVRQHRGSIQVEDAPEGGALFRVLLPAQPDRAATLPEAAPDSRARLSGTVLFIDDMPDVLHTAATLAESLGLDVFTAATVDEALDCLSHHPVHVVVLDWILGTTTGQAVFEAVQTRFPGLPVVITTGFADAPLPAQAGVLAKPYTLHQLGAALAPFVTIWEEAQAAEE